MIHEECTTLTGAWAFPEQLLELAVDDADLLPELIGTFQEDTRARLVRLRAAASGGDAVKVRSEAHTIKGGSRQIGAAPLADACQHLEMHSAELSPAAMMGAVDFIESRFSEVCAAMAQYLEALR